MIFMPRRFDKKKGRLRGTRHHGGGNVKKRRGSGNRGGFGNAGLKKQKWTWTVKYGKDHFGSHGFVNPNPTKEIPTINLWEIENMIKNGNIQKKDEMYFFEWKGKVLGTGNVTVPVKIIAVKVTEKVKEKIKANGGTVEETANKN